MGSGSSKFDDKDDNEFLALDGLSLYNDEYICAIEEKISAGETLTSFEEELLKIKKDVVDLSKQSFDSYNGSLESLATVFSSKFDRLVKVDDFDSFSNTQEKLTAFEFMRGRRHLLLDRILQAQTNMLSQQRSMNESDSSNSSKKRSVYWNLPAGQSETEVRDDAKIGSMLSLTMTLSLAKTLGSQNATMLIAILQNLLQSWASFEALCFASSSALTLATVKQFEDFAMDIIETKYEDQSTGTELKSLAVSFLFAIGVLRGSVELISEASLFMVNLNLKLDSRVYGLMKQLGNIEPKYAMHFPQKCGIAEKFPIAALESNDADSHADSTLSANRTMCAHGSNVYMFDEKTSTLHKISTGGRGSVPGDVLGSCKDVMPLIKNDLEKRGELKKPEKSKKDQTKDKTVKSVKCHLNTELFGAELTVTDEAKLTVVHEDSNVEHWNCVVANKHIPKTTDAGKYTGRAYYEVRIKECSQDSNVGVLMVGFCDESRTTLRHEGNLGNAHSFCLANYLFGGLLQGNGVITTDEFPTFDTGDVIGCGIDLSSRTIFYTKNGQFLHNAFNIDDEEVTVDTLTPVVSMQGGHRTELEFNFGQHSFMYSGELVSGGFAVVTSEEGQEEADKDETDAHSSDHDVESSLTYINGKIYLHCKKHLRSNQFAVFDANMLKFLGIETFSLMKEEATQENAWTVENYTVALTEERFVDIKAQDGVVLELLSATIGDKDVTAQMKDFVLFENTWLLVSTKKVLEVVGVTLSDHNAVLQLSVGWKQRADKVDMLLPVTSYADYLIGVQHVGGESKLYSSYRRLKFVNAKFSSGSADDDLIAVVTSCWENYLEAVAEAKETVLPDIFKADWEFLKKYAKDVEEEEEVGLDLEFVTTNDDEDPYECSYTKEEGITWNDILECLDNEAKDHGDSYRVVFLDTQDHTLKHSFDLELSEAPDFEKSSFDTMELYFNGVQLQANMVMVDSDTVSKISSWKFSFKQNGKFQTFEAAEFDAEKISYNCAANCFDLSTNTFLALTPDGKYILRWKNLGASPALLSSGRDLLKEIGSFDDQRFKALSPTGQSCTIMQILDRISGPYQASDASSSSNSQSNTSSAASASRNFRMLKAEIRESDKKPEVLITVAGKPVIFPDTSKETTGVFVIVFDATFEAEKVKFFSLEDEGALSTTRFVEFIENLPMGKCVLVAITDMNDEDLRHGAYDILKSLGITDQTHSLHKYLIAIGRKGLSPGMADMESGSSSATLSLSRMLPPLHVPMCMEPTSRTMTNLLSICESCTRDYEKDNQSEEIVAFLTPVLNLLALNLKNITSSLPVKAYWKLLGDDVIQRLEKTLKALMTSELKSRPSLQGTITSMFYAAMDLLYSSSNQKVEALRAYSQNNNNSVSSETANASNAASSDGDNDILTILLTDVSLPKNYLSNKHRSGVDRNHTSAILSVCESLFRSELRRAVDRYLTGTAFLQDSLSKLYGTVVNVLSSISTNLLALDLQTVGINQGKLTLNSPSSMTLFLEVFTIMARLSADLLTIVSSAFEQRCKLVANEEKQTEYLRKDFFSFLETSPLASILPTVINAFTRLVKAGGYQFTNKIIDEALSLMKELDRCVVSMGKVYAMVPVGLAKISESVPQKPIKKRVIESEHPYRSNMNEKTHFSFPGATKVQIVFDQASRTETNCDYLIFQDKEGNCLHTDRVERFTGRDGGQNWPGTEGRPPLDLNVSEFTVFFHSDGSVEDWGYKFTVTAFFPPKTGARNRLEWIAKMNLDLVEIQSALAVTLVQGPSWKPIEDEYSSWMENSLVRPEYFSFNPDLEDDVDRFLHDLAELPTDTPAAHFLQVMRRRVPLDQGSVAAINRAVYATCAAIIRANNLSTEAYAIATGKRSQPSDALVKAWTTGQKMREYFKLSDVKSSMEAVNNNGTVQRKPKFSLYEGAPEEVVEEASKEIVARAQFLLRIPKEKDLDNVVSVPSKDDDLLDTDQIDVDLDSMGSISPVRSTTSGAGSGSKWRMAARGVQMMRQVSEESRKANEIWHSLVGEAVVKEKLKNIFEHRRKFAEKNKAANAMTTTEKVLHFVQSDVDIARLHEVNHLRNKRAISRTKGFDMFYRLLSGLAPFPSVVSVVLERFTQTMHKLKREEGAAGAMVHYSTALEGCSPEQNNLLWQKFSAIYRKCVEIIRTTKASLDNTTMSSGEMAASERTILNALHACAMDFDSADHTLVNDSGLVECLEELLAPIPSKDGLKTTSAITQSATSLFELLVGRLVVYEPSADASNTELTPLSKKLITTLEKLLHVGPALVPHVREASSDESILKEKILESGMAISYSTQYSSVTTNTSQLPVAHSIVFWVKRKASPIVDEPFSYASLIGKIVASGFDDAEQLLLATVVDANADTRKVKIRYLLDRRDVELTVPEGDIATIPVNELPFRLIDTNLGGYLFSKGATGVVSDADRRSRVPTITAIEALLTDDARVQVVYQFDEKDPIRLSSTRIPPNVWVQVAVTFDYTNSAAIFVDASHLATRAMKLSSTKIKELESAHPIPTNTQVCEVLAGEGSSTLVWFDPLTTVSSEVGEMKLSQPGVNDWSLKLSAEEMNNAEILPGVNGYGSVLRNGKITFTYQGTEAPTKDWGYKLYYRGVGSKELEEGRNVASRLAWYIGQPPAYLETVADRALKGAMAEIHNLQVFTGRLPMTQLKALHSKDNAIVAMDAISEPMLLRRLSVLRRAVNNLENLADLSMKRFFGTSGLVATLFDLMNHRSAIVKCSALQLASSILPQLEREYVDGNAERQDMMAEKASNFVESILFQVGESLNTWAQRMELMGHEDSENRQSRPKDGYQYLQSLTAIRLNLIRSFVEQHHATISSTSHHSNQHQHHSSANTNKSIWHELSKKSLRVLLTSALESIRRLKKRVALEKEMQQTMSVKQMYKEAEGDLQSATHVFSLLSLLGGVPNSIGLGASVLYVDSDSGMSEEAIYLGPIEKEKEVPSATSSIKPEDDNKEYVAVLLKRQGLKYTAVPKSSITSPNDISVNKDKFGHFVEEFFDMVPMIQLFEEILEISTVDTRAKPSSKEEKIAVEKVFESAHPYANNFETVEEIVIEGADSLEISFDAQSATEKDCDLVFFSKTNDFSDPLGAPFSGRNGSQNWPGCDGRPPLIVPGNSVFYRFASDASNVDWGYKFTVKATSKRAAATGILKPLPVFSTLVQIKMMGMKSLTQVAACSNDLLRAMGGKLQSVIKAAIQPTPSNMVMVSEKVEMKTLIFESTHPYADNMDVTTPVKVAGAKRFIITFDPETRTENNCDYMEFYTDRNRTTRCPNSDKYTGGKDGGQSNWPGMRDRPPLIIEGDSFAFFFHSDGSVNDWGYKMYVQPVAVKAKAKKVAAIRGAGFSMVAAESSFMTLQGVILDGLALPADRHYFNPTFAAAATAAATTSDIPEYHERSIMGLLSKRDELLAGSANALVVPTASVNKTLTVKQTYSVMVDEAAVYENHDLGCSVRSTIRKGSVYGVVDEWNDWLKLKEYRDQRNGFVPEPEIGWVTRRTNNVMTLGLTTTPFVQPMTIANKDEEDKTANVTSKNHPMFMVQDRTDEQQFFQKLISGKVDDRMLLQQDFPAIEEAMNDYAAIASVEHAKKLAELLMTQNDDGYNTEDLDLNDLMSYLNISLSEGFDDKCVDKERAKRMADAVFNLIMNMTNKFGLEEDSHTAALKLVDTAMDLVKTCSVTNMAGTVSQPTQRGYLMSVESDHQYENNMNKDWIVSFPGAKRLELVFAEECSTETNCDYVNIYDASRQNKLYEPKIHGYRSASNKHWPGVAGVPKLVIDRDSCIINFVSDGSTVDWGFKVTVYGIYDEASSEEVAKYEEEQKKMKETSQRMLTMAIWVEHRLAKSPTSSLDSSILRRFYSEENFRIMKTFSLLPVVANHRDEMVDILSAFVTNMGPLIMTNASLRQEFVDLESSIVNTMRLAYFNETENGTKLTQVSTALQAMVQLVLALHQTMSNYLVDDMSTSSKPRSHVLTAHRGVESTTDAQSFDFGWKTFMYDHNHVLPDAKKTLTWEIKCLQMGFTMPVIGLTQQYRPESYTKNRNAVGMNAGVCEVSCSNSGIHVNGLEVVPFPVPVKTLAANDVLQIVYSKETGSIRFAINGAYQPCAVGPAAVTPLIEMNIANMDLGLVISSLNVDDVYEVKVSASSHASGLGSDSSSGSGSNTNNDWLSSVIEVENLFRALEGKMLHSHPMNNGLAPYCSHHAKEIVSVTEADVATATSEEKEFVEIVKEIDIAGASHLVCGFPDLHIGEDDEVLFHSRDGHLLARAQGHHFHVTASHDVASSADTVDPIRPANLVGDANYAGDVRKAEFSTVSYEKVDATSGNPVTHTVVVMPDIVDGEDYQGPGEISPFYFQWADALTDVDVSLDRHFFGWRMVDLPEGSRQRFLIMDTVSPRIISHKNKPANVPTTVKPHYLFGLQDKVAANSKVFSFVNMPLTVDNETKTYKVVVLVDKDQQSGPVRSRLSTKGSVIEKHANSLWLKSNAVGFLKTVSTSGGSAGASGDATKVLKEGSKVVRGPAWCYGKEDGGSGHIGEVKLIREWKESPKMGVMVRWPSGYEGYYRYGYESNYDVILVEEDDHHQPHHHASAASEKVHIHNKQLLEIAGSFVRMTVRMSKAKASEPVSSETAAAVPGPEREVNKKDNRMVQCGIVPVFPRKVCLEDARFEDYRKKLESVFMPKNAATLNALAKYLDKTLQARDISKDRFVRMKWMELQPTPEDLVRSALLKELVEQPPIEIQDGSQSSKEGASTGGHADEDTNNSKSLDKKQDEDLGFGGGLATGGLISEEQATEVLAAIAEAERVQRQSGRRRRRNRHREDDDESDNDSDDDSNDDEDDDDEDEDEDDDENEEEDEEEEEEDADLGGLFGDDEGSVSRSVSRASSASRRSSRRSSRASSVSASVGNYNNNNSNNDNNNAPDMPSFGMFFEGEDTASALSSTMTGLEAALPEGVFLPCGRCNKPIQEQRFDSGWSCDCPDHEGYNHFSGGVIFGCETFRACNWWMCPACHERCHRNLTSVFSGQPLPESTHSSQDKDTDNNNNNKKSGSKPRVQKFKQVETLFQMIQALNFHLMRAIPMIDLHRSKPLPGSLTHTLSRHRPLILSAIKQDLFNTALDNTRGNGGQFELYLSRSKARKYAALGKPDVDGNWSVFAQAFRVMHPMNPVTLRRNDRLYITKLMGEHAQDAGGPYRESFDTYCQELQSSSLSLFVRTANGRGAVGMNREKWVLNPAATSRTELEMLAFVGKLMGIAIRSKEYLALNIPSMIWKLLAGDTPTLEDLEAVDVSIVNSLKKVVDAEGTDAENFSYVYCLTYTTMSSDLREVELVPGGAEKEVTYESRADYRDRVIQYRLHEFDRQAAAVRSGLATIVPIDLLNLFTWDQLEEMVCGKAEIDVELLKSVTEYSSCSPTDAHVQFFWQVMDEFTNEERCALIRFAWGRSRLPLTAAGFSQRFKIQNLEKHPADGHLPEAHTCFFSIDLPRYSTLEITREKVRYVIFNCTAIDGDDTSTGMQVAAMGWEE